MKYLIFFLFFVNFISYHADAAETDNFLALDEEIEDASTQINKFYNWIIKKELSRSNRHAFNKSCAWITFNMGLRFTKGIEGRTNVWIKKNGNIDRIPRYYTSDKNYHRISIYRNVRKLGHLAPTININGINLGSDKISHAFGFGFLYYIEYRSVYKRLSKRYSHKLSHLMAVNEMIKMGVKSEKGFVGQGRLAGGIFSYADLEANYQGFLFYYNLCYGNEPYLKKFNKKWYMVRPFNIKKYITPHYDETYYPSRFNDDRFEQVKGYMREYCYKLNLYRVQKQRKYYETFRPSYSVKLLEKYIKKGKSPDPELHSLVKLCK